MTLLVNHWRPVLNRWRPTRALHLLRNPDSVPVDDLRDLVRSVADAPDVWEPRLELPVGTDRWWTRLHGERRFDVWLLSWLPGHHTDLHDHGASEAAFTVVRGELTEMRFDPDGWWTRHRRETGSVTSLPPGMVHDVYGAGHAPAVSVHAYSPPLQGMNYYERDVRGRLRVVRSVDARQREQVLVP